MSRPPASVRPSPTASAATRLSRPPTTALALDVAQSRHGTPRWSSSERSERVETTHHPRDPRARLTASAPRSRHGCYATCSTTKRASSHRRHARLTAARPGLDTVATATSSVEQRAKRACRDHPPRRRDPRARLTASAPGSRHGCYATCSTTETPRRSPRSRHGCYPASLVEQRAKRACRDHPPRPATHAPTSPALRPGLDTVATQPARPPNEGARPTSAVGAQASMTTGMIIGRRRWALSTQRPTTRRTVCWSW